MTYVICGGHDSGLWLLLKARNITVMYMRWMLTGRRNITMSCGSWLLKPILAVMKGLSMSVLLGMHVPNLQCCVDSLRVVCLPTSGQRDQSDKRGQSLATAVLNKLFCMSPGVSPLYAKDRLLFTAMLTEHVDALPVCTKYAGIIPMAGTLTNEQAVALHRMLVTIWQKHIKSFHEGERAHQESLRIQEPVNDESPVGADEYTENGHLLAPRVGNPGVYCRTCGKFVARMKHIRLKITSQPCAHKDAPPERWVSGEGWGQASARLDALEYDLHNKYNKGGHSLTWNRRVGKIAGKAKRGSSHVFCVSGSGDGKIEYPICRELSAMVLRLGRATVLRGRQHRGSWSDEMTVMFVLPMLVMLLPFQDTVSVDLVGGWSWGSCAPHAQANTNF